MPTPFPTPADLNICFAHVAYQMESTFARRETGLRHFQVWSRQELTNRLPEADVLVVSGFWQNSLLENAPRLRFIQSIGAGTDQFDKSALAERGIRLFLQA